MNDTMRVPRILHELSMIESMDIEVFICLKTNIGEIYQKLLAREAEQAFRSVDRTNYSFSEIEPDKAAALATYTGLRKDGKSYVFCERRKGGYAAIFATDADGKITDRFYSCDVFEIHDIFETFSGSWRAPSRPRPKLENDDTVMYRYVIDDEGYPIFEEDDGNDYEAT